ncbi:DUF5665 domain-containing protein [Poseidonocella sedimentorum]|uniref:Uncharacterized protein n=1 Tax=Poseidonocella sedimentorum TaxID=871652 RepID=A0A1I6E958_9RHOB|nr:DUF5665 domain-containing protein [Poseidonocella sedimentorum]SFR14283.1 hypothetical protein SAMN04515673_108113 [Poseidonocella sedimentorum]
MSDKSEIEIMDALRRELARLNDHRFIKVQNSTLRLIWFQFLRGLAFGLGSVVGATILVSLIGFWLAQIEFIPIIGDWAVQLAEEIGVSVAEEVSEELDSQPD